MTRRLKHCVWELTLACNLRCIHCGSTAGRSRAHELDAGEALVVADALADLGCERVTLMGGEPFLRSDWADIAGRLTSSGVIVEVLTNGHLVDDGALRQLEDSGVASVSVSVDGTPEVHDRLRDRAGSFEEALGAVARLKAAGFPVGVVTQINRMNLPTLPGLYRHLLAAAVDGWQLQLSEALGRFKDHDQLTVLPEDLPGIEAFLLSVIEEGKLWAYAADNIGYMSRSEPVIRAGNRSSRSFWCGCHAGVRILGITSDGWVRGCLSLPDEFNQANLRDRSLQEIWADDALFRINRDPAAKGLTGFCADCAFRRVCGAGCTSLAFSATGGVGDNPYCLFRVGEEARGGGR
ncbi:MAG: radical SAM protein [Pseudomonadota bacterium]